MDMSTLNKRSVSIAKAIGRIDKIIHQHCLAIAVFINGEGNGNVTPATFFLAQFPEKTSGLRTNAIRQWFLDFAGCSWNDQKKTFGRASGFHFDLHAATVNPYNVWKPEADFKPVDGAKLLESVIKKMRAALADTAHSTEHKVDPNMLAALELVSIGAYSVDDKDDTETDHDGLTIDGEIVKKDEQDGQDEQPQLQIVG